MTDAATQHRANDNPPTDGVAPDPGGPRVSDRATDRRTFLRGCMVLGGTAAAGGSALRYGADEAEAAAPIAAYLAVSGGVIAASAVSTIAYGAMVDGPDDEEVADALDWQVHVNEFTRAREDRLSLEETIASIQRDVQLIENKAREEAIFRIYEQGVDSGSEADAQAAAEEAINETYAILQRSILNSYGIRIERIDTVHNNLGLGEVVQLDGDTSDIKYYDGKVENTITLLDGTTHTSKGFTDSNYDASMETAEDWDDFSEYSSWGLHYRISKPDPADYESVDEDDALDIEEEHVLMNDWEAWAIAWRDLQDRHDDLIAEVPDMVDTYFQPAQDGEIDLHNMLGPAHLSDTAENAEDFQEAAMALRSMGYPMSHETVTISLPSDDEEEDRIHLDGRLSWTAHNGNTLPVGEEIDPGSTVGSIFAAVNAPGDNEGAEHFELTGPFIIENAEGNDSVAFEDRDVATSDTTTEEINVIFEENRTANDEAVENTHDTATSGGGAGLDMFAIGDIPGIGVFLVIVGTIVAFVSTNN